MLKRALFGVITVTIGVVLALTTLELLLRVYHGQLFTFASQLPQPPDRLATPHAEYHPRLGWVPKPGEFERSAQERWRIDSAGLRTNGAVFVSPKRPILAIGDSFTFGDEVLDAQTWPAQLQQLLRAPVINGGVFAYGVDQAYLRAILLLEKYQPQIVLFAFMGNDIVRNELSYYSAWKPYFEYSLGELTLRNVPVPRGPAPRPPFAALRSAVGYSFLGSAVLRRVASTWWHYGAVERKHKDGAAIAIDLLTRLDTLVRSADATLVIIALGAKGSNQQAVTVAEQVRARGLNVLDLVAPVEESIAEGQADLFMRMGHYSPRWNGAVAERVAEYVAKRR